MTITRIEELMTKKSLTLAERSEVRAAADEMGIAYVVKKGCRTCYEKILLALYERTDERRRNVSRDGWLLRNRHDNLRIGGLVVNEGNIHTLTIGSIHPAVLAQFFIKSKESEE